MGEHVEHLGFVIPDEIVLQPDTARRWRWPLHGRCERCQRIQPAIYRAFTSEAICFACTRDIVTSRRFLRGKAEPLPPLPPFDYDWWNRHLDAVPR